MMIDTSERDLIVLSIFNEKEIHHIRREVNNRELLKIIEEYLKEQHRTKDVIEGMMVVVGEGGFTSTRLATTVANTFAYVQQIPVLAISKEQSNDPQAFISTLCDQPVGQYISATYSASPSINTGKKNT